MVPTVARSSSGFLVVIVRVSGSTHKSSEAKYDSTKSENNYYGERVPKFTADISATAITPVRISEYTTPQHKYTITVDA